MVDENMIQRILDDFLEYDEDVRTLGGIPFSGVGYRLYPNKEIKSETSYLNGFPDGVSREWDPSGVLVSEVSCRRGMKHGMELCWFPNGALKRIAEYEWGVEIGCKELDENGKELISRVLNEKSLDSNFKILQRFRRLYGKPDLN